MKDRLNILNDEIVRVRKRTESRGFLLLDIKRKEARIKELEEELREEKKYRNTKRKGLKKEVYNRNRFRIAASTLDMRKKAYDYLLNRIRKLAVKGVANLDAVSGHAVLRLFAKQNKIKEEILCTGVIAYHYTWITKKEMYLYGYSDKVAARILKSMLMNGYMVLQRFSTAESQYIPTPKMEKMVDDFHRHYVKCTTELYAQIHKKHKYHQKIKVTKLPKIIKKRTEDADKQKNQEREQGS